MDQLTAVLSSLFTNRDSAAAVKPYSYSQLKGQHMIRLLELHSVEDGGPNELHGRLVEADCHGGTAYEAISYTWGNPVFDQSLKLPEGQLMITSNLASALRRFRSIDSSSPRFLWADQVCINQADIPERNQQVSIMNEIYTNAERGFMWLGAGNEETDVAIALLKEIASAAESCGVRDTTDGIDYFPDRPRKSAEEEKALADLASSTDFTKLWPLYNLPWFSRVWISQEVALPPEVIFFCGAQQISYNDLAIGTSVLNKIAQTPKIKTVKLVDGLHRSIDLIGLRQIRIKLGKTRPTASNQSPQVNAVAHPNKNTGKEPTVSEKPAWVPAWGNQKIMDYVATVGRNSLCFDDRDRVYAMISLHADNDVDIEPDYSLSVEEVYADFSRKCLAKQEVRILSYAGLATRSEASIRNSGKDSFELPSWAVDWRAHFPVKFGGANKQLYTAGFGMNPAVRVEEQNGCVSFAGVLIDLISVGKEINVQGFDRNRPLDFNFEPSRRSILSLKEFFDSYHPSEQYSANETSLTAFARTIIADIVPTGVSHLKSLFKSPQSAEEMVNLWQLFEKVKIKEDGALDLGQGVVLPTSDPSQPYSRAETVHMMWLYMTSLAALLKQRQFFLTKRSYIGLAPAMSRPGDAIVLAGGSQAPLVLRPDREKRIFRIVGECYLHGFMNRELLTDDRPRLTLTVY